MFLKRSIVKNLIFLFFEKIVSVLKKKNQENHQYVNSDSLDRDRLEHFLRSGRYLGGISK